MLIATNTNRKGFSKCIATYERQVRKEFSDDPSYNKITVLFSPVSGLQKERWPKFLLLSSNFPSILCGHYEVMWNYGILKTIKHLLGQHKTWLWKIQLCQVQMMDRTSELVLPHPVLTTPYGTRHLNQWLIWKETSFTIHNKIKI